MLVGILNNSKIMRSNTVRQKLKSLKRVLDHLKNDRIIVLVEGKRDIYALKNSHFYEGQVFQVSTRKPYELAQLLIGSDKTVVILTDYDNSGEQLLERFTEELVANNIQVDITTRKTLRWILGLRTIEDLPTAYADFVTQVACAQHEICLSEDVLHIFENKDELALCNRK